MKVKRDFIPVEVTTVVTKERVLLDLSPVEAAQVRNVLEAVHEGQLEAPPIKYANVNEDWCGYGTTLGRLVESIDAAGVRFGFDSVADDERDR